MFNEPIAIVDIETTGGSARNCKIIEIAIIRIENGRVVDEYQTFVNPGMAIPAFITGITGINNDSVRDAPYFSEVAEQVNKILNGAIFMAHNVMFDFSFVKRQLEGCGFSFKPKLLCSVKLSRHIYPDYKGHSLEKIINRHNIRVSSRHRAYDDAKAVWDFLQIIAKEHGEEQLALALKRQLKLKSLPSNIDASYLEGIPNSPGVYIFEDATSTPIYIGKSIKLRTRILSHFTQATKLNKEMKISMNTHKLRVIETESELEALLLESKMVKEHLPIYNQQLRHKREHVVLFKNTTETGYDCISMLEKSESEMTDPSQIFGVYENRTKAKKALENARQTFNLCSKLLGLEKANSACFHYQLKKCKGACVGTEPPTIHNLRLQLAFERSRIANWKYKTPIIIQCGQDTGIVVDHWKIIGKIRLHDSSEPEFEEIEPSFDLDNYKILRNFVTNIQNADFIQPFSSLSWSLVS